MKTGRPVLDGGEHQVLKFRPRTSAHPPQRKATAPGHAASDLSQFEHSPAQPDDYRHRMLTNAVAAVFTAILVATGIWLAIKIADLRSTQDCVLMGRKDCAHVSAPKS
jgi:hypothetical protein